MSSEVERAVEFRAVEAMLDTGRQPGGLEPGSRHRSLAHPRLLKQLTSTPAPQDTAEAIHRAALIDRIE